MDYIKCYNMINDSVGKQEDILNFLTNKFISVKGHNEIETDKELEKMRKALMDLKDAQIKALKELHLKEMRLQK